MPTLQKISAREVLDSRGYPTVEVEAVSPHPKHPSELLVARAIVPSGASTGEGEALELRDGDKKRYQGKGVNHALANVREKIAPALIGKNFAAQADFDRALNELDGTPNKLRLGANAILPVSMAFARITAQAADKPLYASLASVYGSDGTTLPVPLMNILNGGKHADNGLAIQEFMIVPAGFARFSDALRAGAEVFHQLKNNLHSLGLATGVGDEGGFAPVFQGKNAHEQVIQTILKAIESAGYRAGSDIFLALDCAASEFCKNGAYDFEGEPRTAEEMVSLYSQWAAKYPILSIEDGLAEHDWDGWKQLTEALGRKCQLIGDDIFVTNPIFLKKAIESQTANAILIKLNQIGTVTETLETMRIAKQNSYAQIVSHRSGESEDTFIADLAVGTDCGQIKTGSASRTDRISKYNQLLRIEEELGSRGRFLGLRAFSRAVVSGR